MRKLIFPLLFSSVCLLLPVANAYAQGGRPIPPGIREADKQTNAPVEPPTSSQAARTRAADPAVLKQEADELAQLSAGVPSDISLLANGKLPKDLQDKLKRIEKLAKHLRGELSR